MAKYINIEIYAQTSSESNAFVTNLRTMNGNGNPYLYRYHARVEPPSNDGVIEMKAKFGGKIPNYPAAYITLEGLESEPVVLTETSEKAVADALAQLQQIPTDSTDKNLIKALNVENKISTATNKKHYLWFLLLIPILIAAFFGFKHYKKIK
jgi:hypothetical protein